MGSPEKRLLKHNVTKMIHLHIELALRMINLHVLVQTNEVVADTQWLQLEQEGPDGPA